MRSLHLALPAPVRLKYPRILDLNCPRGYDEFASLRMQTIITWCGLAGVQEWVCCPGGRNIAVLQALSHCKNLKLWTHFDERAAGFFALGRIQDTSRPVAISVTSGTAVAELLPAVIEAYYQKRPLVVITADRPPEYSGTGAPQCIEQNNLFGTYAPTFNLTHPISATSLPDLDFLISEGKPVHVNIHLPEPRADKELPVFSCPVAEVPPPPPFRSSLSELSRMLRFKAQEGLVLLLSGLEPEEQEPALWLAETLRVPILADATSGLREEESIAPYILHDGDLLLRQTPPPFVLRVGDIPTGRFWRDLEALPKTEVFSLTRTGFSGLARPSHTIEGNLDAILRALGDIPHVGDVLNLRKASHRREALIEELILTYPESEAALTRALSQQACLGNRIFLGNSSPIRLWNQYAQRQVPVCYVRANRGANGIDGLMATFLGNAASGGEAWCFMGDLSALYDANAGMMLSQLRNGKRVVAVLNNRGGGIFRQLPGGNNLSSEMERLLIQPHNHDMQALADMWGARLLRLCCTADFELLEQLSENDFVLAEIIPDADQTEAFNHRMALK